MDMQETLGYIHSLGKFSKPAGLSRIKEVLSRLGEPQNAWEAVHVAGTNGKGSVSVMLAAVLQAAGYRTGLTVSPFITDFRERIQVNGTMISEEELICCAQRVRQTGVELTEFELITAMAFLFFREQGCRVVVAETGLGGRLDATNALTKVRAAVITKIGMDHAAILGDTVEKIAAEKCGIILPGIPAIASCRQKPEALAVIRRSAPDLTVPDLKKLRVLQCDSSGNAFLYHNKEYRLSLCGEYQIENALTVIETLRRVYPQIPYETVRDALAAVRFPARAEIIGRQPLCVLDGAHNPDGAAALAQIMRKVKEPITAIIGVMRDKEYHTVLNDTLPFCKAAVAVTVEGMPRSLNAADLRDAAAEFCPCRVAADYQEALALAFDLAAGGPVFVFGSLYLASGIREQLIGFYKKKFLSPP